MRAALLLVVVSGCIAHEALGDAAAARGDYRSALAEYDEALESEGGSISVRGKRAEVREAARLAALERARACLARKDWECTEDALDETLELSPSDETAHELAEEAERARAEQRRAAIEANVKPDRELVGREVHEPDLVPSMEPQLIPLPQVSASDAVALWRAKCASCHGDDGRAKTKIGRKENINDMTWPSWQRMHTDAKLRFLILQGVPSTKMKGFDGRLSAAELVALVRHIRTFESREPAP